MSISTEFENDSGKGSFQTGLKIFKSYKEEFLRINEMDLVVVYDWGFASSFFYFRSKHLKWTIQNIFEKRGKFFEKEESSFLDAAKT